MFNKLWALYLREGPTNLVIQVDVGDVKLKLLCRVLNEMASSVTNENNTDCDIKKSWRHSWHIDTDAVQESLPLSAASTLSLDLSPGNVSSTLDTQ